MQMIMFILLIIIGIMCIISRLIIRYKFKIPKASYIDVNTLQPKYLKYILITLFIFTFLISVPLGHVRYPFICLFIKNVIDSAYRIKYLKNDKSRYYIVIELVFWVYGCISIVASLFW